MHKITAKKFTRDDFSCEHLLSLEENDPALFSDVPSALHICDTGCVYSPLGMMDMTIDILNDCRDRYLTTKNKPMKNEYARKELMKKYWWQMIQLLPSSYNQKSTIKLNYQVLANIYHYRKDHKLDEWHTFCDWIKTLPYSKLITGEDTE